MTDIKSMLLSELQEDFALRGLQKFRAAQVYRWLHQRGATSFDEMTDLSKDLRVALKESFEIRNTEIAIRRVSKIDGTKKYLFRLNDGEMIESVLMQHVEHGSGAAGFRVHTTDHHLRNSRLNDGSGAHRTLLQGHVHRKAL